MKHLIDYLIESNINNIFETSVNALRYLIGEFEKTSDETLMSGEQFYDASQKLQKCISKDDLKRIFQYAKDHNNLKEIKARPEPLVANYGNKQFEFAFRRWVKDAVQDLDIHINGNLSSLYHDTNLKGNGSWVPTAQDMEDVIAIGYNNVNKINKLSESKNEKIEQIIKYYQDNSTVIDAIAKTIKPGNSPLKKLQTKGIYGTEKWAKLGKFKSISSINKTPKTDLISADHKLKISLKEEGGSQLMSGGYHEALATILTAIEKSNCANEAKELIGSLDVEWITGFKDIDGITKIKNNPNHKDYELIKNAVTNGNNVQRLLNELISKNKDFEYELLYEAMTGETKFGVNNPASANYILIWNDKNPSNSSFMTPKEYIQHLLEYSSIKYLINFKSANNSSWQNMRIICGNASSKDSEKIEIKAL